MIRLYYRPQGGCITVYTQIMWFLNHVGTKFWAEHKIQELLNSGQRSESEDLQSIYEHDVCTL